VRCWRSLEAACGAACLLLVGTGPFGCTVYDDNISWPASDAARERNLPEASSDGSDKPPEPPGADGHPNDAGGAPGDSANDATVDASDDPGDDHADGAGPAGTDARLDTSLDARLDTSLDARLDTSLDATEDEPGPKVDVTDAGKEPIDNADAIFDVFAEGDATVDAADPRDVVDAEARDAVDTGPTGLGLIDDMEDNDNFILAREGRQGVWFTVNDGTPGASQTPGSPFTMSTIAQGRGTSLYAARSSGYGFASWRPLMGFWFHQPPTGPKQIYDVGRYRGITFMARLAASDGATVSPSVRVVVPDRATDPDGLVCTVCNDHFGANVSLTAQWTSYTILFAAMTQEGWGTQVAQFDAAHAYGIKFEFPVQATFDCWIDDIAFVP
jgi:hypothetical protein